MVIFEELKEQHRKSVIDIFNYYVENTNAAYPQEKVDLSAFDVFLENAKAICGFAILDEDKRIIGFCQLKPYRPGETFKEAVEITYFLSSDSTRKGIGTQILAKLESEARKKGIKHILASISGDNFPSLNFHKKNGFIECGRFVKIGYKLRKHFDIVYMQKDIE